MNKMYTYKYTRRSHFFSFENQILIWKSVYLRETLHVFEYPHEKPTKRDFCLNTYANYLKKHKNNKNKIAS